ncbi:N-acetyltransferase family protein [Lentzea chajnantorensis]
MLTEDLVLRPGTAADTDAVAALHGRCSMGTLFNRYHSGMSTVPRRWLHRLLSPSRGTTTVVQNGDRLIALGQLIRTGLPGCAEVSLLVEDAWQRRGVGAALLSALASEAELFGCREARGVVPAFVDRSGADGRFRRFARCDPPGGRTGPGLHRATGKHARSAESGRYWGKIALKNAETLLRDRLRLS